MGAVGSSRLPFFQLMSSLSSWKHYTRAEIPQDLDVTVRGLARGARWGPIAHGQSVRWQNRVPWTGDIYVMLSSPQAC